MDQHPLAETRCAGLIVAAYQRKVDIAQDAADLHFGLIAVEGMNLSGDAYAHRSFSSQFSQASIPSPRVAETSRISMSGFTSRA